MFKPGSKYHGVFLVLFTGLLTFSSAMNFYSFSTSKKGMELTGGIVFGVMAIIYVTDIYEFYKNKKSINRGA